MASVEAKAGGGSKGAETRGTRLAKYGGLTFGIGAAIFGFERAAIAGLAVAAGGWGVEKLRERREKKGGLLFARNAPVFERQKAA